MATWLLADGVPQARAAPTEDDVPPPQLRQRLEDTYIACIEYAIQVTFNINVLLLSRCLLTVFFCLLDHEIMDCVPCSSLAVHLLQEYSGGRFWCFTNRSHAELTTRYGGFCSPVFLIFRDRVSPIFFKSIVTAGYRREWSEHGEAPVNSRAFWGSGVGDG